MYSVMIYDQSDIDFGRNDGGKIIRSACGAGVPRRIFVLFEGIPTRKEALDVVTYYFRHDTRWSGTPALARWEDALGSSYCEDGSHFRTAPYQLCTDGEDNPVSIFIFETD